MTLADYSMAAFALLNGGRTLAYFPQMIRVYRDPHDAAAVSLGSCEVLEATIERNAIREMNASIDEAREDAAEDGTRSILDIETVGDEPDFGVAAPLDPELLEELYETTRPTRRMIEENMEFLEDVERGHCVYTVVYKDGKPDELFFAGYSYD